VGFDLSLNPGYLKTFPSHNNNKEVSTGCYGAGRNFSILCCFDRVLSSGFDSCIDPRHWGSGGKQTGECFKHGLYECEGKEMLVSIVSLH
jgi:hypothetical protein